MTLEKLPVVLILHLKYFDYRSDGCTKILKKVEFPVELKIDASMWSCPPCRLCINYSNLSQKSLARRKRRRSSGPIGCLPSSTTMARRPPRAITSRMCSTRATAAGCATTTARWSRSARSTFSSRTRRGCLTSCTTAAPTRCPSSSSSKPHSRAPPRTVQEQAERWAAALRRRMPGTSEEVTSSNSVVKIHENFKC